MLPDDFSVYDHIADPVFVLTRGASGEVVYSYMNKAGLVHIDHDLSDIIGRSAGDTFSGRASQSVRTRQHEAWEAGAAMDYEIALPIGDTVLWVRTALTPVHDDTGRLTHMVGISRDITRERALEQAQAMTSTLTSEMEEFVSLAAHDLRSPILNVRSLADMLREGFVDMGDGKLELINMIEEISERSLSLVTDVLAQASASNAVASIREFDFQSLCTDILVTLDPSQRHAVTVPGLVVESDYTAMQVVLRNLIDNAFKHAGNNQIAMSLSVGAADDGLLTITVCDDGQGFADPALAFLDGGELRMDSGFGLLGVRRLIRARGGDISAVPPSSGLGAEVRFSLPGRVVGTDEVEEEPARVAG